LLRLDTAGGRCYETNTEMSIHTLFFAQAQTTLDRLKTVPPAFWGKVGLGGGLLFFNWIYHRSEPKFLTPFVDRIAPFFPTAGAYNAKQATTPGDTNKK